MMISKQGAKVPVLVSADSHFLDPPDMWQRWLPAEYRDRAPKLVEDGNSGQGWLYAGARKPETIGLAGLPGRASDELRPDGIKYSDIREGTFDGASRCADQDQDGVSAEVIYPTSRPMGHFLDDPDRQLVLAGVAAYNRFVQEEFCAAAPGRLFPVAQLPTTGVDDCIETLKWAANRRFVAVVLPCWPTGSDHLGYADLAFFKTAEELDMPVCMHVSLRSREERLLWRELNMQKVMDPDVEMATVSHQRKTADMTPQPLEYHHRTPNFGVALGKAATVFSDLVMSGLFDACPNLKLGLIETWVGWIPRALEAVDDLWEKNRYWRNIPLKRKPSDYWYSNMSASFLDDRIGVAARRAIGVDNMMWSTDYPHFGTFWPRSRETVVRTLGSIPASEQKRILSENAIRFYGLADRLRVIST
jgi:predicted TIM-barrel fold metal-dependent hydrolase